MVRITVTVTVTVAVTVLLVDSWLTVTVVVVREVWGGGGGASKKHENCLRIMFQENLGGPQQKILKRNGKKIKSKALGLLIEELRPGSTAGRNQ